MSKMFALLSKAGAVNVWSHMTNSLSRRHSVEDPQPTLHHWPATVKAAFVKGRRPTLGSEVHLAPAACESCQ